MDLSDPTRCEDLWIDTLKAHRVLIILTHTISYCFCIFTSYHCIYRNVYFCYFRIGLFLRENSWFTCYFYFYFRYLFVELWNPAQKILFSASLSCHLSACFYCFYSCLISGRCSFLLKYSTSGNWSCTNVFLLIVCTVMLQNYFEGRIVKLYIQER